MATHNLFVYHNSDGDDNVNASSIRYNIELLEFLARNIKKINSLGVSIVVHDIGDSDLQNVDLVNMLEEKRITSFPALQTTKGLYMGVDEIIKVYSDNLKQQRSIDEVEREGEEVLREYFDTELVDVDIDEKDEDDAADESKDMMAKYNEALSQRMGGKKDGSAGDEAASSVSSRKRPPPKWARRIIGDGSKKDRIDPVEHARGRNRRATSDEDGGTQSRMHSRNDNVSVGENDDGLDVVLRSIRDVGEEEDAEDIRLSEKFWENTKSTKI